MLHLYQGRLANSSIRSTPRYQHRTPILCFENDIRQVLNNLVANAIDAMRQGGSSSAPRCRRAHHRPASASPAPTAAATPRRASASPSPTPATAWPPTIRARAFEAFYTTKELNGTGLGLWISGGIVARHHGRITLRSSEHPRHHGTVFSIFLPHIAEAQIQEAKFHEAKFPDATSLSG